MKTVNDVLQDGLHKNEVLALDIAEHCGFYSGLDNYGVQHFPKNGAQPKYMGSDYDQYRAFGRWLRDTITEKGIKDCSGCLVPHARNGYGYVIGKYSEISDLVSEQIRLQREEAQKGEEK